MGLLLQKTKIRKRKKQKMDDKGEGGRASMPRRADRDTERLEK